VGGRSFGVTERDRAEGSLTTDKGSGRAEAVLSDAEGAEHDTN